MTVIGNPLCAILAAALLFSSPLFAGAGTETPDGPVLTALLHAFLLGASQNDPVVHDRFWSEELVYTSSGGARFGKAEIMAELESAGDDEPAVYTAEDIRIQQFDDAAVVAFRLVASPLSADGMVAEYFNTGTFVKTQGRWQAVAWQATKIPAE